MTLVKAVVLMNMGGPAKVSPQQLTLRSLAELETDASTGRGRARLSPASF